MANATLSGQTGIKTGNFNLRAAFGESVFGFDGSDVVVTILSGPTDAHIQVGVSGTGGDYNIAFVLPDDEAGSFRVALMGQVIPESSITSENPTGTAEAIVATSVTITYDTHSSVAVVFGELRYENTQIILPIHFAEDVNHFHKTDCELKKLFGDDIFDFDYYLVDSDARNFELVITPTANRRGAFMVNITGYIFKTALAIRDNVVVTPKLIPYNAYVPYVINANIPDQLTSGTWDILIETNVPAIGVGKDDFIIEYEGTLPDGFEDDIVLYRAQSLDVEPEHPAPPVDPDNPPECIGDWVLDTTGNSVVEAKYFILRFQIPSSMLGEQLSITPKQDAFRVPAIGG